MEATFYGSYVQRLNRLSAAFAPLTEVAIAEVDSEEVIQPTLDTPSAGGTDLFPRG